MLKNNDTLDVKEAEQIISKDSTTYAESNLLLEMCEEIRIELAEYFNVLVDVKIFEFGNYNFKGKYAGFCNIGRTQDKRIYLQLKDYNTLQQLEPSTIIPTLLHEFAHYLAPNVIEPHDEPFYEAFGHIVSKANKKGIYHFTYNGDLKRSDQLDMSLKMGYSLKYPNSVRPKNMTRIQINCKSTTNSYFYDDSIDLHTFIKNKFKLKHDFDVEAPEKITPNCIVRVVVKK